MMELAANIKKIPFGSDTHRKVIAAFQDRYSLSRDKQWEKRREEWDRMEDVCLGYFPADTEQQLRTTKQKSGEKVYADISIPYSFAMLLTAHTYYTSVFLSRDPVFQVNGRHGEAQTAESMIESLLAYQLCAEGNLPALYVWLFDPGKYGYGVIGHYWEKETFTLTREIEVPRKIFGLELGGEPKREFVQEEMYGYVGNKFYNIRPHNVYFDPRVPLMRFQEGEFVIVYDKVGWIQMLKGMADGRYYNLDALKTNRGGENLGDDESVNNSQLDVAGQDLNYYTSDDRSPASVDLYTFHWDIVPSHLGLGKGDRPEKWVFTISNKRVVVSAQPLGLAHNKYPLDVIPFEVEGYGLFSRGMMDMLDPLNKTMEWLINSHFYNVRSVLNNSLVYDPRSVEQRDLENPNPGKLVRLKGPARGRPIKDVLMQLPMQDITRSHLSDYQMMGELGQRMVGVADNVMGMVNAGGRKTATEIRSSTSFSTNRLKTNCEWFSAIGWAPFTHKNIVAIQQLLDVEMKLRVVGDQARWGERYMMVNPAMLGGSYDFVPVDGTLPIDRFAQMSMWNQLLGNLANTGMMQGYDVGKIFAFVAQLGGIKNIDKFRIQVVPDETAVQQAQAGNLVPAQADGIGAAG